MSDLRFEPFSIRGHKVGKASWFPAVRELIKSEFAAELDEDDGLFIGFGMIGDGLPYTLQDDYDGPEETLTFQSVVLENEFLKAVFLPELGGRLWSLYDKVEQRDVILENTRLLPCNLAIRNAWFAGGVEFNCGRRGHDEQTMSPRFAAVIETEKFPVLRIYEYQRDRGTPFQYDCFLPDNSRFLFIRGRIWNPNREMVPMYWWSNIALPEVKGSRVVVPATTTFANWYQGGNHMLAKLSLPDGEGFDGTYPVSFPIVRDHFYNIPDDSRKYECLFYPDGYGFCHVSTKNLKGRKLFVWGQSQGGRHWNKKLLGPEQDAYIEVQAGLGRSQQECLPMPPRTAWEWLEGYGAVRIAPEKVFGEWQTAIDEVTALLDEMIPAADLETMLAETRQSIALKPGKTVITGSGWGALEEMRMNEKLSAQLDFGTIGDEQKIWADLLKNNCITDDNIFSYLISEPWFNKVSQAEESWQKEYFSALYYYRKGDLRSADEALEKAKNGSRKHILHLLANLRMKQGRMQEAAEAIYLAGKETPADASFNKEVLKMLLGLGEYEKMADLLNTMDPEVRKLPFIQFMDACVCAYTGKLDEAEQILMQDGGLNIPDIREGENSASKIYIYIQQKKAELAGKIIEPDQVVVPFNLDFRMS